MRVILAKTLLVVFLAILPSQQAYSQGASSSNSGNSSFLYRLAAFQGVYATGFCQTRTDHCLRLAGGSAFLTVLISYPIEGFARKSCNKLEGESMWCTIPGAERDFTHLR